MPLKEVPHAPDFAAPRKRLLSVFSCIVFSAQAQSPPGNQSHARWLAAATRAAFYANKRDGRVVDTYYRIRKGVSWGLAPPGCDLKRIPDHCAKRGRRCTTTYRTGRMGSRRYYINDFSQRLETKPGLRLW